MNQVENSGNDCANKRCDHVCPEIVVDLSGRRLKAIISNKFSDGAIFRIVRIVVLTDRKRDVATSESRVPSTLTILLGQFRHCIEKIRDRNNLKQSIVGKLCAIVLDRDECKD